MHSTPLRPAGNAARSAVVRALPEAVTSMQLNVHVTLGRTTMPLKDIFKLTVGSVIELGQPASAPADFVVNGKVIARGQIVVLNGQYGLKVLSTLSHDKPGE
jgi:flagellar motor switch protein FliN